MKLTRRSTNALRCALCHDGFASSAFECQACGSRLHRECAGEAEACPTYGCPGTPADVLRVHVRARLACLGAVIVVISVGGLAPRVGRRAPPPPPPVCGLSVRDAEGAPRRDPPARRNDASADATPLDRAIRALRDAGVAERVDAARALREAPATSRVHDALLRAALFDDAQVVRAAAVSSVRERDSRAAGAVFAIALGDRDFRVRDAASDALSALGEPAVDALLVAIADDPGLRPAAASVLERLARHPDARVRDLAEWTFASRFQTVR